MSNVNKVLYNVDQRSDTTDAEKKTARDNIGATASEVFVAKFGETSYASIVAAYKAGKVVIAVAVGQTDPGVKVYECAFFNNNDIDSATYVRFASFGYNKTYYITCTNTDMWSSGFCFANKIGCSTYGPVALFLSDDYYPLCYFDGNLRNAGNRAIELKALCTSGMTSINLFCNDAHTGYSWVAVGSRTTFNGTNSTTTMTPFKASGVINADGHLIVDSVETNILSNTNVSIHWDIQIMFKTLPNNETGFSVNVHVDKWFDSSANETRMMATIS